MAVALAAWSSGVVNDLQITLRALAIFAGAALLLWPAYVNGYPILVFGYPCVPGAAPSPARMVWDKPTIYPTRSCWRCMAAHAVAAGGGAGAADVLAACCG